MSAARAASPHSYISATSAWNLSQGIRMDYLADVPAPVLLNTWKHHAAATRQRIGMLAGGGDAALRKLADQLVVIGSELMDIYTGDLTPAAIAGHVIATL
jgi:hypothetical protein